MAGDRVEPRPLAAVRDARASVERRARARLAAALAALQEACERLDLSRAREQHARAALATAVSTRTTMLAAGGTPASLILADRFVARRRRERERAGAESGRAQAEVDARQADADDARRDLAAARADRELVERHVAARHDARRKLDARRDD